MAGARGEAGERSLWCVPRGGELWTGALAPGRRLAWFDRWRPSLLWIEQGPARLRSARTTRTVSDGDVCAVREGEVVSLEPLGRTPLRHRVLVMPGPSDGRPGGILVTQDAGLRRACAELEAGADGAVSRVAAAMRRLARGARSVDRRSGCVLDAMRRIEEALDRAEPTDALARSVGLGKYQLIRRFSKEVGVPPHTYRVYCRLSLARSLLRAGVPISIVAARSGFADQSHLSRWFSRVHGLTPGAYASLRSGPGNDGTARRLEPASSSSVPRRVPDPSSA